MKHRGTLILAVIGLGLALSASIPFFASQAAPADVVQAELPARGGVGGWAGAVAAAG